MDTLEELKHIKEQFATASMYLSKAVDTRGHTRLTLQGLALFAAEDIRNLTKENERLKKEIVRLGEQVNDCWERKDGS